MARHRDHGEHRQRSDGQLLRVLFACAVTAGWCVIGGTLVCSVLERTGLLAHWIESELRLRFAGTGAEIEVGSANISWLNRTLVLREVTLRAEDESGPAGSSQDSLAPTHKDFDTPEIRLAELRLVLQLRASLSLRLSQVGLRGGHVHVTPQLRSFFERLGETNSEREQDPRRSNPLTPLIRVEGIDCAWEGSQGIVHLGRSTGTWIPNGQSSRLWAHIDPTGARRNLDPKVGHGLVIRGELSPDGALSVQGQARDLQIDESLLPVGTPLAVLRDLAPSGRLSLDLSGHYVLGQSLPQAEMRLEIMDGGLLLPDTEEELRKVQGLDLSLRLSTKPGAEFSLAGEVSADVHHLGMDLQLRGQMGADYKGADLGEFWVYSPAIGLNDTTMALAQSTQALVNLREMLLPEGTVAVAAGVRAPQGWRPRPEAFKKLTFCAQVEGTGDVSLAYVGGRNFRQGGVRNLGFPRRIYDIHGRTVYNYIPDLDLSERLGFFGLSANSGPEGRINASGGLLMRPTWLNPTWKLGDPLDSEFSLELEALSLPVDDELRDSFAGLGGVAGAADVVSEYDPNHGHLDFTLRFFDPLGLQAMAMDLDVELKEVDLSWAPVPLSIQATNGQLRILTNGHIDPALGRGVALFNLDAASPGSEGGLTTAGQFAFLGPLTTRAWSRVHASEMQLRSTDLREALKVFSPETLTAMENTAVRGWVDMDVDFTKPSLESSRFTNTSITPTGPGLRGRTQSFPMDTEQVHGRILVRSEGSDPDPLDPDRVIPSETRMRAELLGAWLPGPASVPLAFSIDQPIADETHIQIRIAGLDINNPTFRGALREMSAGSEDRAGAPETSSLDYSGHLDGTAEVILGPDPEAPAKSTELRVQTRLDRLRFGGTELLRNLTGTVTFRDIEQGWAGERLTALLGNTPIELTDFSYAPTPEGNLLKTSLRGIGLPIDEDHLGLFLDEDLQRILLDDLQASGTLDVETGQMQMHVRDSGQNTLEFNGDLAIRDAGITMGIPIKVSQAHKVHLALGVEGTRVRALVKVAELDGALAERSLTNASFQMTFLDTRLTIEELNGEFEGGSLRPLGASSMGPATFFSIDLVEPFDFSLSADLKDVDAGRLLAGMFNSDFANEGSLDAEMRLQGAISELTEVQGEGQMTLRESALWSIPVFQSLFSQLGFDTTAVFSRMESRFKIDDGRVEFERMRMKSDLLSLVGHGWVDFDGSISYDLRVRYSLVDRLGPFTQFLYWIQNGLLRVSIQGDMSRPKVLLKGLFSSFYRNPKQSRRLPLPGISPLPQHF